MSQARHPGTDEDDMQAAAASPTSAGGGHPDANLSQVIASAVHDMKNSLGMLLSTVEDLFEQLPTLDEAQRGLLSTLHYEAHRLNNDLIHLLAFYRISENRLPIQFLEHQIQDLLEDQVAFNQVILQGKKIAAEIECDDSLTGVLDESLVSGVINNVLVNAIRYAQRRVILSAYRDPGDNHLVIQVEDDGVGYPEAMTQNPGGYFTRVDFQSGSTGLGLYFASRIAAIHQRQGITGRIELENGGRLGGGVFRLILP